MRCLRSERSAGQRRLCAGNLEIVTAYLMPQNVELIKAVRKRHQAELDFRTEAANLRECSKNMRRRGFEPRLVRLPRVVDVSRQRCCWHLGLHSSRDGKRYRCWQDRLCTRHVL